MSAAARSTRWTFVTLGAIYGTWAVRIPDIAHRAGARDGDLGIALLTLAAGSLVGMPLAGRGLRTMGMPTLVRGLTLTFAAVATLLAAATSMPTLLVAAAFFGLVNGAYGVVINTGATALESRSGHRVVASCHASFSVATLTASLVGGALVTRVPPWAHLAIIGAACAVLTLLAAPHLTQPEHTTPNGGSHERAPRSLVVTAAAALACVALFSEGVVTDWSTSFMQHAVLDGPGPAQTWGYAGFSLAMATGRATGDRLLARHGEMRVLAASLAFAFTGYAVIPTTHGVGSAVAAFACIGIGLSNLYPAMISLAARRVPLGEQHRAVATVSGIGYFGFLAGPGLIGMAADTLGLRTAMGVPAVALLGGVGLLLIIVRAPALQD